MLIVWVGLVLLGWRRPFFYQRNRTITSWLQRNICRATMILNTHHHGPVQTTCRKSSTSSQHLIIVPYLILGHRVSISGTDAAEWDKNTWGPLEDLARNHPGAGVHFQGIYGISHSIHVFFTKQLVQNVRYTTERRMSGQRRPIGSKSCYPPTLGSPGLSQTWVLKGH